MKFLIYYEDRSSWVRDEKGQLAIEVRNPNIPDSARNIWTLNEKACTDEVLKAIMSAFRVGYETCRDEILQDLQKTRNLEVKEDFYRKTDS